MHHYLKGHACAEVGVEAIFRPPEILAQAISLLSTSRFPTPGGIDDPEHALPIGSLRLSPTHLEKFDVIRRGDDVFADWEIDENSLLKCTFRIPSIGKDYNLANMYVSAAGHKSFDGEDGSLIAASALANAQEDVDALERWLKSSVAKEISDMRRRLEKCRADLRISDDADSRRKIFEEARIIRQEAAQIKAKPENIKATVDAGLQSFVKSCSIDILPMLEGNTNTRFHRLAGLAGIHLIKVLLKRLKTQGIQSTRCARSYFPIS